MEQENELLLYGDKPAIEAIDVLNTREESLRTRNNARQVLQEELADKLAMLESKIAEILDNRADFLKLAA